jgi:O-acetyl-ADP-ribose deacetylase
MQISIGDSVITLVRGDITELAVDAIVNAANSKLILGDGVAGAIRKKAGPVVQEECDKIGGTPSGTAVLTGAGKLPAKHVIHAVGPIMGSGDEDRTLADATRSALVLAEENGIRSIAFPAISAGTFGFPAERCAKVMLTTTIAMLKSGNRINRVIFCLFDDSMYNVFQEELNRLIT